MRVPVFLVLGVTTVAAWAAAANADLSGRWRVDPAHSDDAAAQIEGAAGSANVSGYGSNDIHFGGGGGARSEVERVELREWLLALAKQTERFEIEHSPEKVTIVHGEAGVRTFYFGRKSTRNAEDGRRLEVEARWEGPRLVLHQTGKDGLKVAETYAVLPGGQEMRWSATVQSKWLKKPLEMKRVYLRASAD
jgi:hypothetical protein